MFNELNGIVKGRWLVTITKYKKSRSLNQNNFYHGCVVPAVKDGLVDMGFDKYLMDNETVHEFLKSKFLKQDVGVESGEFITITKSTAKLSTTEFIDYIAEIQAWSSTFLNIYIPDPGEQSELNYDRA